MYYRIARELGTGGLSVYAMMEGIPSSEITTWAAIFAHEDEEAKKG